MNVFLLLASVVVAPHVSVIAPHVSPPVAHSTVAPHATVAPHPTVHSAPAESVHATPHVEAHVAPAMPSPHVISSRTYPWWMFMREHGGNAYETCRCTGGGCSPRKCICSSHCPPYDGTTVNCVEE